MGPLSTMAPTIVGVIVTLLSVTLCAATVQCCGSQASTLRKPYGMNRSSLTNHSADITVGVLYFRVPTLGFAKPTPP